MKLNIFYDIASCKKEQNRPSKTGCFESAIFKRSDRNEKDPYYFLIVFDNFLIVFL